MGHKAQENNGFLPVGEPSACKLFYIPVTWSVGVVRLGILTTWTLKVRSSEVRYSLRSTPLKTTLESF